MKLCMRNPRLIRKISIGKNREINKKNDNFFLTFLKQEYFYRRDSPSVPLEFPKLANAQPSNFGPLRIFRSQCFVIKTWEIKPDTNV